MDLRELYQTTILDHNKRPRNFREAKDANRHADGDNPLCGDKIHVSVCLDDDTVRDVGFQGEGCAISQASASLMTESVKGRPLPEVLALFERFHALIAGNDDETPAPETLGKLAVFTGVREFPMRVKCATLAWHTLRAALEGDDTASTE